MKDRWINVKNVNLAKLQAIFDWRLYGRTFLLRSLPFLVIGFLIQSYLVFVLNRQVLAFFAPFVFVLILVCALGAKNVSREFRPIGYYLGLLFLIASLLAETSAFLIRVENSLYGAFQILLVFSISIAAFVISTTHIAVWGQRVSLRESARLTDDFFKKKKEKWKNELAGFPNLNNILEGLDNGRFVADLFDSGSFNLVVLWSCNVMEKIIDAAAEGIISKEPPKRRLFKKEDGSSERYPLQLKNLGYDTDPENRNRDDQISIEALWHKIRNDVAHRNYRPTFFETYGALTILVSFMERMPKTLQSCEFPS